jgi:hypothetical protein
VLRATITILAISICLAGCSKPEYDASSPQAALDAMHQMIADGHPEMLGRMVHIEARDIAYEDGVTEASAIENVIDKTGDMLGQLYRVAGKLRTRFPDQVQTELNRAGDAAKRNDLDFITQFLADPFGLMDRERSRVSVNDLGDGTAAILIDGKPPLGFGLLMREIDGQWRVDVPIDMLQNYRPDTREEWKVVANIMLAIENSLTAFETELDRGEFRDLRQASNRAGRLLGERVIVQAIIYEQMKNSQRATRDQPAATGS